MALADDLIDAIALNKCCKTGPFVLGSIKKSRIRIDCGKNRYMESSLVSFD